MQDNMHGNKWRGDNFTPLNKIKFSVRCYAMELQLNECFCGDMDSLVFVCYFPWWGDICVWYISMCVYGYTCKNTHVCRHICGGEGTMSMNAESRS